MTIASAIKRTLTMWIIAVSTTLVVGDAIAAPYKWVDKSGQIHYSQVPPANHSAKEVDIAIHHPKSSDSKPTHQASDSDDLQLKLEKAEKQEMEKVAQRRKENCISAKHNLMVLQNNNHVREKIDGEYRVLSQEKREERIARLSKQTNELCK